MDGDYGFSTAVGLNNTVINVILLVTMNSLVKKMNHGKGIQREVRIMKTKKKSEFSSFLPAIKLC